MKSNQLLEFTPRWEYKDGPDEEARELRDEAMATAALAYTLSADQTVRLSSSDEVTTMTPHDLASRSYGLFDESLAVSGQSGLSEAVTRHHLGRAMILDRNHQGLSVIRAAQQDIERTIGEEDSQLWSNVLGGTMLVAAGVGEPEEYDKYKRQLQEVIPGLENPQRLKRKANIVAAVAINGLRKKSPEGALALTRRALRGPILFEQVEE